MKEDATYEEACHAVQSGVAFELGQGSECASPKHLRTGLNLRASEHAGLARLLVRKGLISEEEYLEVVRQAAIMEVNLYEAHLSKIFGVEIRLG